jgi:hypothetical protein
VGPPSPFKSANCAAKPGNRGFLIGKSDFEVILHIKMVFLHIKWAFLHMKMVFLEDLHIKTVFLHIKKVFWGDFTWCFITCFIVNLGFFDAILIRKRVF